MQKLGKKARRSGGKGKVDVVVREQIRKLTRLGGKLVLACL